jgi:hypothetical protein
VLEGLTPTGCKPETDPTAFVSVFFCVTRRTSATKPSTLPAKPLVDTQHIEHATTNTLAVAA